MLETGTGLTALDVPLCWLEELSENIKTGGGGMVLSMFKGAPRTGKRDSK